MNKKVTSSSLLGIVLILFVLFGHPAASQSLGPKSLISSKDLQADALHLKKLLESFHPATYWYTKEVRAFNNELLEQDSISYYDALIELSRIANSIRCGHTAIHSPKELEKYYAKNDRLYLKYRFHEEGGKIKVGRAFDGEQCIPVGAEIRRINSFSVDSLYHLFYELSTTDGYNDSKKNLKAQESFSGYYRYYIEDVDSHHYVYNYENKTQQIKEAALTLNLKQRLGLLKADQLYWTSSAALSDKDHKLIILEELESTAVLQISSFSNTGPKFYSDAFKYLKNEGIKNLIIDLRNCPGGKVADSFVLLSYLLENPVEMNFISKRIDLDEMYEHYSSPFSYNITNFVLGILGKKTLNNSIRKYTVKLQPRKKKFEGALKVLVNESSFSASCIVAAQIAHQENCTVLGLETGGGYRQSSAMIIPTFNLPNTLFRVQIPLYQIIHDTKAGIYGHGIFPDVSLPRSFNDKVDHTDLEFQYLLEKEERLSKNDN